eukprot:364731-Chlamydomonas_euryale.AAC.18
MIPERQRRRQRRHRDGFCPCNSCCCCCRCAAPMVRSHPPHEFLDTDSNVHSNRRQQATLARTSRPRRIAAACSDRMRHFGRIGE